MIRPGLPKHEEDSKAGIQRSQSSHFRVSQGLGSGDLEPDISGERANTNLSLPRVSVETQAAKREVLGFSLYSLLWPPRSPRRNVASCQTNALWKPLLPQTDTPRRTSKPSQHSLACGSHSGKRPELASERALALQVGRTRL